MRETIVVNVGPEHLKQLDRIVDPLVVTDVRDGDLGAARAPRGRRRAPVDRPGRAPGLRRRPRPGRRARARLPARGAGLRRRPRLAAHDAVARAHRGRVRPAEPPCRARHDLVGDRAHPRGLGGLRAPPARLADLAPGLAPRRDDVAPGRRCAAARGRGAGRSRSSCRPRRRCRCPASPASTSGRPRGPAISLERGTGGLTARRTERDGTQRTWTVLGASRGEPGILGEGLRQALVRDPTFSEALDAARELA